MNDSAPRILIVRLSALGDIIHTLPLLAALRDRWPGAHLGWLCEPAGAPLLEGHPMLNALHLVPRRAMKANFLAAWRGPMAELTRDLKAARYDLAIDVQGLTKSAFWPWKAGIPRRIGFAGRDSREFAGLLATERIPPGPDAIHIVERNLELLRPLGIARLSPVTFPVNLTEAARARAARILGSEAGGSEGGAASLHPLVLLLLGAGWETKIWPPERFGELARRLAVARGCRVALAWGPGAAEEALGMAALRAAGASVASQDGASAAAQGVPRESGVWALPATSFMELGAVLARARLAVGGDTGPTHLAAALGISTIGLMGPLDARRNGPCGPRAQTIQHAVPHRAPWWRNHRRWCDPATAMSGIGVEEVYQACQAELAKRNR